MENLAASAFRRHYGEVFRFVRRRTDSEDEAEEITQSVFVHGLQAARWFLGSRCILLAGEAGTDIPRIRLRTGLRTDGLLDARHRRRRSGWQGKCHGAAVLDLRGGRSVRARVVPSLAAGGARGLVESLILVTSVPRREFDKQGLATLRLAAAHPHTSLLLLADGHGESARAVIVPGCLRPSGSPSMEPYCPRSPWALGPGCMCRTSVGRCGSKARSDHTHRIPRIEPDIS
jgi:hypothetical protein